MDGKADGAQEAYLHVFNRLEPQLIARDGRCLSMDTATTLASIAISLKRIADVMGTPTTSISELQDTIDNAADQIRDGCSVISSAIDRAVREL